MKPGEQGGEPVLSAHDLVTATSEDETEGSMDAAGMTEDPPVPDGKEKENDRGDRIYGEVCATCGSTRLRRNGTCKVCEDCGATTGCS